MNTRNCHPELKTVNYLKKNLLYCFEPQLRSQLKEQIERMEDNFFSKEQLSTERVQNAGKDKEVMEGDKRWKDISDFKQSAKSKALKRRGPKVEEEED